jgi:hypothetical protein
MNYFVRAGWVIAIAFTVLVLGSRGRWRPLRELMHYDSHTIARVGWGLLGSLVVLHVVFH